MSDVNNHDIVFLNAKLVRVVEEVQHSQSSNVSVLNEFDLKRMNAYLDDLDACVVWIQDQPQLDLPETAPTVWVLPDLPVEIDCENEALNQVGRLLRVGRDELVSSQSARLPAHLMEVDQARFVAVVEKIRKLINDYVAGMPVLDLPESSPQEPVTPAGKKGTKQSAGK